LDAQLPDEELDFERPEAWAMRYFAGVALMQGNGAPPGLEPGHFAFGLDVVQIPHLSSEQRRIGFNGTKEENLNKAPVLVRPLLHYAITERWSLTGSYVPPIEVFDRLRTHVGALSVNFVALDEGRWRGTVRGIGQWTRARGDFTCAEEIAGNPDPMVNPFLCEEPSNDTFTSWTAGVELMAEYRLSPRWSAFANAAYTYADLTFDVDAHYSGIHDQRRLTASGPIWSLGVGARYAVTERLSAALSLVHVPLDLRRPPDYGSESDSLTHIRLSINLLN
jgi:hypothetical protein